LVKFLRDRAAETFVPFDGVDTNQLLSHLPGLLQGEAAAWFRNNRQRWCDWKGFVTDFRLFYFPVSHQEDLEVEISRRLQRPTEPVTTYLTELQALLRRHGCLQLEQQLSWMYSNLHPGVQVTFEAIRAHRHSHTATLRPGVRSPTPGANAAHRKARQTHRPRRGAGQPHQSGTPLRRRLPPHQPQGSSPPPPCACGVDRQVTSVVSAPGQ
jgi:hypothetical protein